MLEIAGPKPRSMLLSAASPSDRATWVQDFKNGIDFVRKRNRRSLAPSLSQEISRAQAEQDAHSHTTIGDLVSPALGYVRRKSLVATSGGS